MSDRSRNGVRMYANGREIGPPPWRNGVRIYANGQEVTNALRMTTTTLAFNSTWYGPSGDIWVDWDDGSVQQYTLVPGGTAVNHAYGAGTKIIRVYGDLHQVTRIDAISNSITIISHFSLLTNLDNLNLSINNIINISALITLTSLTSLSLYNNNISDISSLANLTNLTFLDLYNNNISDISPLAGLTSLTALDLHNNNISDISPLAGLINLIGLYLHNNSISDVSAVISLSNLIYLYFHNNNITYPGYTWFTATSGIFRFDSTVTTSAESDQYFIDFDSDLWANVFIYANGTNPAVTPASLAARLGLAARGCTLFFN